MAEVSFVLHGHFYQPPRENPWTEVVPREPSAAPFHDWNERITAESYRPNGWARILDDQGRIVAIVDNYEQLSFDVGPTLLSWLDEHAPSTYARILAADRASRRAIAQAYGHAILPLCNDRDLRTQIRWGLADFRHRFGREPEGLWLPETAVDERVLAALAEEGVGFTILAPGQIAEIGPLGGDGEWRPADPSGAGTPSVLRWQHPTIPGAGVDLVVYDGPLSHDVAFGGFPSQVVVDRIVGADRQLVALACDGETFGHHHRFADRGVAYALTVEAPRRGVHLPRLADWLADHPPTEQARVRLSSWSCAHGVDRWKADCGCHTGGAPGWDQAWRAPLRAAFDLVREAAVEVFERRGAGLLRDPWAARDAYVDVLLGRVTPERFAEVHVLGEAPGGAVEALTLLESQRHALLMYTSCGWFFNDLAGIETLQIMRYGARCLDLLAELGERAPVEAVLDLLAEARSNRPDEGDGRSVWRRYVEPSRVDPGRIVAHLALTELLAGDDTASELGGFAVEREVADAVHRGGVAVCAGRLALTHRRTRRRTVWAYGAVHLGGLEVSGAVRPGSDDPEADAADVSSFLAATRDGERVTELLREVVERFGSPGDEGPDGDAAGPARGGGVVRNGFGLESALPSEGGDVARTVAAALADRFVAAYEQLRADNHDTLAALAVAETPLPAELQGPVEAALARRLEVELAEAAGSTDPTAYRGVRAVVREACEEGVRLRSRRAAATLSRAVASAVDGASTEVTDEAVAAAAGMVALARDLDIDVDLDVAQELVYGALHHGDLAPDDRARLAGLARLLGVRAAPAG